MRGRWFRFYDEALNDPKVQCLAGDLFKTWVNLLCLASKHSGVLPATPEIAYCLRMTPDAASAALKELAQAVLLDCDDDGQWRPHNWNGRQTKSDNSTGRVQKHRKAKRRRNGDVTANETDIEREREEEKVTDTFSSSLSAAETSPQPPPSQAPPRSAAVGSVPPSPPPRPLNAGMSPDVGDDYRAPPTGDRIPAPPMTDANQTALNQLLNGKPNPRRGPFT
jgi:hypothetical protein